MKVYVAETGCYSNKDIEGVYGSFERAISPLPGKKWKHYLIAEENYWSNELDWDEFAQVWEMELQ